MAEVSELYEYTAWQTIQAAQSNLKHNVQVLNQAVYMEPESVSLHELDLLIHRLCLTRNALEECLVGKLNGKFGRA